MPNPVAHQGEITISEIPDSAGDKGLQDSIYTFGIAQTEEKEPHDSAALDLLPLGVAAIVLLLVTFFLWYRHTTKKKQERTARQMAEKYAEGKSLNVTGWPVSCTTVSATNCWP